MSTVGFSKGDSSAIYTSFRGGGILANYDKKKYQEVNKSGRKVRNEMESLQVKKT